MLLNITTSDTVLPALIQFPQHSNFFQHSIHNFEDICISCSGTFLVYFLYWVKWTSFLRQGKSLLEIAQGCHVAVEPMRFVLHDIPLDGKQSTHANVAVVKKPAVFNNVLGLCSQSTMLHFHQFFKWFWHSLWRYCFVLTSYQ
jgi:hypothetical protein